MPAFLHYYPGLTPDSYALLDVDHWDAMKQFIEPLMENSQQARR